MTTLYYGYLCTENYLENPVTVHKELVPRSQLPLLQMSFCKLVKLADCRPPQSPVNIFGTTADYYYDYYYDEEPGKNIGIELYCFFLSSKQFCKKGIKSNVNRIKRQYLLRLS